MPLIHVKHMVCARCERAVRTVFEDVGLKPMAVRLGEVEVATAPTEAQERDLRAQLAEQGFELITDRRGRIVEQVKTLVIEAIHHGQGKPVHQNFSDWLSEAVGLDYPYLSSLFSSHESLTIERYIILQKIERVKELLVYEELTLSEIADQLGYSSTQHLSTQFKAVTGLTPTAFRKEHGARRGLDQVTGHPH